MKSNQSNQKSLLFTTVHTYPKFLMVSLTQWSLAIKKKKKGCGYLYFEVHVFLHLDVLHPRTQLEVTSLCAWCVTGIHVQSTGYGERASKPHHRENTSRGIVRGELQHLYHWFPNVRWFVETQVEALLEVCGYIYVISFLVSEGMKKHKWRHY